MPAGGPKQGARWREWLDTVATIAVIVLCGTVVWALAFRQPAASARETPARANARPPVPPLPAEPVSIANATILGSGSARLALIAYSEFQCPYCGVFARDTLPALRARYIDTGKVLLVFRHFPLDGLHAFARRAAQAADCAARQGRFLELHDAMFATQAELDASRVAAHVGAIGLDGGRFSACLDGDEAAKRVAEDVASGRALGVTGTPTFFVGAIEPDGRVTLLQRISGARPLEDFVLVLDKWLSEVPAADSGAP